MRGAGSCRLTIHTITHTIARFAALDVLSIGHIADTVPLSRGALMSMASTISGREIGKPRALIYDDDEIYAEEFSEALARIGYVTDTRAGRTNFPQLVSIFAPDLLILDLHMPGRDGVEVLRVLRDYERKQEMTVVLVSAAGKVMLESASNLAVAYGIRLLGALPKPLKLADLTALLLRSSSADDKTAQI